MVALGRSVRQPHSARRAKSGVLQALAIACLVLFGCERPSAKKATTTDLELWSKRMGVEFPTNTIPEWIWHRPGLDDSVYLRVRLAATSLVVFKKSPAFRDAVWRSDRKFVPRVLHRKIDWWEVDSVKRFESTSVLWRDTTFLNVLISLDKSEYVTVFLQWGET